ncbi:MAG: VTT domain-containing protein [Ignavibacteria bacterium]|nr:VTT domain-containing protein [Ignavibacteria bacterium]
MELINELFKSITDPSFLPTFIKNIGYIGLIIIIFSETGLLAGFFLPGDSLLVSAGLLAATPVIPGSEETYLNIILLNVFLIPAAIVGDAVGYWIGNKTGPKLFKKEQSLLFRKDYLIKTHEFYEKHGGITIVIARFMPIIRTFAPTVAGIAEMKYRDFFKYNVFGGIFWVLSMTLIGYLLGNTIPDINQHIEKVIIIVVFLSILPGIYKYVKHKLGKKKDVSKKNV